jgi:PEP-CTERM motif-containing protein
LHIFAYQIVLCLGHFAMRLMIMKRILVAMIMGIMAVGCFCATAQAVLITFTENSSTSLTSSFGSAPVLVGSGDHWTWTGTFSNCCSSLSASTPQLWSEPSGSLVNSIDRISISINCGTSCTAIVTLNILSDTSATGTVHANGTTATNVFSLDGTSYDVAFNDIGDTSTSVPEPSTFLLLGSGLIAIADTTGRRRRGHRA